MDLPTIEPISEADLAFLRGVDSPTIANAIEPFKVRDRTEGFIGGNVRALFPDLPPTVGYALTVTMNDEPGPVKGREGFWAMFEALERMPAPSVVVVQDTSGHPERVAFCGEVMATMAQKLGAVGYVTDGTVRDLLEVRALGLAYFASGVCVSHANFWIEEVGVDVVLDGQTVRTGDLLHGDANGIVVVPREVLPGLPEAVRKVREREGELMAFARSSEFSLEGAKKLTGYR
ncbi:MAG TPA: RraA family protein [Thermomicrobiales bacterium]|nr:RraA family protein [Thermomicrobiales bacterium]